MPYSHQALQQTQRPCADAWLRARLGVLNLLAFALAYGCAQWRTSTVESPLHFAMPIDAHVPLWTAMVWPYLGSLPLLIACFALAPAGDSLRTFSRRMLCITALAGVSFALFPAVNTFQFPDATQGVAAQLLNVLNRLDGNGNQLPSLHVAYAALAMTLTPQLKRWQGLIACFALLLLAASALLTHRHHVADAIAGLILTAAVVVCVRPLRPVPDVTLHYTAFALIGFSTAFNAGYTLLGLYLAVSLARVAWAYQRNDATLAKKRSGRVPLSTWLLLAPWLLGYRITWWLQRARTRGAPPFQYWLPDLLVGRRLSAREARMLPDHCSIIDLSAELDETPALRGGAYHHVPLLDLRAPTEEALRKISATIDAERAAGRCVYLHCSMGIARSVQVARAIAPDRSLA